MAFGKCWKLHLQKRKESLRGLDGLEWLLWQFYRSTDDIFTEDGAESFPRWTPCFRFNPDHFFFLFLLQDSISLLRGHCSSTAGRLSIFFPLKQKILDELTVIKPHWLTLNAKCRSSFHFIKASYSLDFFLLKELHPYLMDM